MSSLGKQAIVIGSSMSGLTAAHVLSQHFEHVIVIERDRLNDAPEARNGVPQGRQPHGLLVRGQMILESYFPGLVQELRDTGAASVNMGSQFHGFMFGKWRPVYDSPLVGTSCSRPLLESAVYRRVKANPKIEFLTQIEVTGLCVDEARQHATGVQLRSRSHNANGSQPDAPGTTLAADLVVDASGRDSHAPDWLKQLGYEPPQETVVDARPGYASRVYAKPADFKGEWEILYALPSAPGGQRGAIIMAMEGQRWHVCMIGMDADYPPTDEEGFLAFARSLPTPAIYDAIKNAKPLTSILGYRRADSRLRAFDKMPRYLEGFIALGDSVCAFDPVYGQGMTVASLASAVLNDCLSKQETQSTLNGFAQEFQKQLAKVVKGPWQLATGEDMRWIKDAKVDFPTRLIQKYVELVLRGMMVDQPLAEAFLRVQNMVDTPTALFKPKVMTRVFRVAFQNRNKNASSPVTETARTESRQPEGALGR